jgi:hypothetical protein
MAFGVTEKGFVAKRLSDIMDETKGALERVKDPISGESLQVDFDENDPFIQVINAIMAGRAETWGVMDMVYGTNDPSRASKEALSGVVQLTGTLREPGESDQDLRIKREKGVESLGSGPVEAIQSALASKVPGVSFARVYVNNKDATDARGILPKHFAPGVVGGSDDDVAHMLLEKVGAGVPYHVGNKLKTLVDGQGEPYDIRWTVPDPVEVYVDVELVILDASIYPANGDDLVAQRVVDYAMKGGSGLTDTALFEPSGFTIGEDVTRSRLYTPLNTVPGHRVKSLKIGTTPGTTSENDIDITVFQTSAWDVSRVTVVSSGA